MNKLWSKLCLKLPMVRLTGVPTIIGVVIIMLHSWNCMTFNLVPDRSTMYVALMLIVSSLLLQGFWGWFAMKVKPVLSVPKSKADAVIDWLFCNNGKFPIDTLHTPGNDDPVQRSRIMIERHLRDIPGCKKLRPNRWKGLVVVIETEEEARSICHKHKQSYARLAGFHLARENISYILKPKISTPAHFLSVCLHEQLHSYVEDESFVEYMTYYLMLHYGYREEVEWAKEMIHYYATWCTSEYDFCIEHFWRAITAKSA